jgi:hypothetical protein
MKSPQKPTRPKAEEMVSAQASAATPQKSTGSAENWWDRFRYPARGFIPASGADLG